MLPGGLDAMYRAALATSHQPYRLVEVLDGSGNVLESGLTFIDGSIEATLTSRVARTCNMVFEESMYPFAASDLLAPYGNRLRCWRGIEYADGSHIAWVGFTGRIQESTLEESGTCSVFASDVATDVIDVKFPLPQNSQAGTSVEHQVKELISNAVPDAQYGDFDDSGLSVQALTWQLDRGQALDELASSAGAFWYPLNDGRFVMRRYAWTVPGSPVVTYRDADGGSVFSSSAQRSREGVYNSLTVTGERLNGDAPVFATAVNDNPDSPTYINGNFGRRHQLLRLQTPSATGAALSSARENLAKLGALAESWTWTMTADAALELGDVVGLEVHGHTGIVQVVSSFSLPMGLSSPMRVAGRSQVLSVLEGVE